MPTLEPIKFKKANVDITIEPPSNLPLVKSALLENKAFPNEAFTDKAISFGAIKASANKEINLDNISFGAGASAFSELGVYRSTQKLLDDLKVSGVNEPLISGITFPDMEKNNLVALRWGYSVKGEVEGKIPNIAFGVGLNFGASGQQSGLYSVIHSVNRNKKSVDSLTETINCWRIPSQIETPKNLESGTVLIAETNSKIKFSLGLQYGYDFSWVKEAVKIGSLSGDFGLKLEMGIKTSIGFSASGRYALAISHGDTEKEIRLRVYKLKQKGWSFSFDASLISQVEQDVVPDNFDEFIKGVFNINGHQVLKDFEKWSAEDTTIANLLGVELVDYAKKMVKEVTGFDPDTDWDKALGRLNEVLNKWKVLPQETSSLIYEFINKKIPLDDLKDFLKQIIELSDEEKLKELIKSKLEDVNYSDSPIGKWLTAFTSGKILSLLSNFDKNKKDLKIEATRLLGLLDGSTVEETFTKLQSWIEEKLKLEKITDISNKAKFENIDKWLKTRLSAFLGKTIVFEQLEEIKNAIKTLRDKAGDFYQEGYKALTQEYQANFLGTFQKATSKTAIIDVTFDFNKDATKAKTLLKEALKGNFDEILFQPTPIPTVKVNTAVLTHEINRNTHIKVGLPYFSTFKKHITDSKSKVVELDGSRLWVFSLEASDSVSKKNSLSKLSISMNLTSKTGVRQFSKESHTYDYSLRLAKRNVRRAYFERNISPLANEYFSSEFTSAGNESFSTFLTTTDKLLDNLGIPKDAHLNTNDQNANRFGHVLTKLDVSVSGKILSAWKNAPNQRKDHVYMKISRKIQEILRIYVPLTYIQNLQKYTDIDKIYPLLAYSSLPPMNDPKIKAGGNVELTEKGLYWKFNDPKLLSAILNQFCANTLKQTTLPKLRSLLSEKKGILKFYRDTEIKDIIIATQKSFGLGHFRSLVIKEREIIKDIVSASIKFRKFLDAKNVDDAIKELAKFGAKFTDAFNENIGGGVYGNPAMRPLGTMIFLEVAKILNEDSEIIDEDFEKIEPLAMLEISYLKEDTDFKAKTFLDGEIPKKDQIALTQRIVN